MSNSHSHSGGISFAGLLTITFIGAIALCVCIEDFRRRRRQAVERAKAAPGNTPRG